LRGAFSLRRPRTVFGSPRARPGRRGGLATDGLERTLAQPHRIALALLGKLDDGARHHFGRRVLAVDQAQSLERVLERPNQELAVVRGERVIFLDDETDWHGGASVTERDGLVVGGQQPTGGGSAHHAQSRRSSIKQRGSSNGSVVPKLTAERGS